MEFINLKGIVIREVNVGEADRYIDLFTDKLGKVTIYVKSVRSTRSRNLLGAQLLNYCGYVLVKKKDKYYISSSELIESFYDIRNDMVSLTYAVHFLDIINSVICENESQIALLKLLLNTLYVLSKRKKDPKLICSVFELRLLKIIGYEPDIKECVHCGRDEGIVYFDISNGGLICDLCKKISKNKVVLRAGVLKALKFILGVSQKDVFKFNLDEACIKDLSKLSRNYLRDKLDKEYNKLDFLDHIN